MKNQYIGKYTRANNIFTESELRFYKLLKEAITDTETILAKVRMEDVICVSKHVYDKKKAWGLRSRIKSRHLDFVVCDQHTGQILLAVELDDPTHLQKRRRERDEFVNAAFEAAGVPLLHYWSDMVSAEGLHDDMVRALVKTVSA